MDLNLEKLQEKIISLAREAGAAILEVYHSADFEIEHKKDDSPLTRADWDAHQIIANGLVDSPFPLLSEEGKSIDYAERKNWEYFWMVDPLDGTKEFIKKNGEFTVNIALIHQGKSILGVVYAPVLDELFTGAQDQGAFMINKAGEKIALEKRVKVDIPEVYTIIASRSHRNEATQNFIDQYPRSEEMSMGSSLKFMLIASGKAQVYPRVAPTMEWDTAAAQIIVEETGGQVLEFESRTPVRYNKENLLNPYFVVYGHPNYAISD